MKKYSILINLIRNFLNKLNFIELFTQNKLSILTICNDPKSMCTFNYGGYVWPLPQSGIIWLEHELINLNEMNNPGGIYTMCTCYKNDPNYTRKMSENIFEADIVTPIFEFAAFGQYSDMQTMVINLLQELGFRTKFNIINYNQIAKKRGSRELDITDIVTDKIVTFLEYIPNPKWGMKYTTQVIILQTDVLTFSEHITDSNDLLETFYTYDNGSLAEYLYSQFSKERVDDELYKFINTREKNIVSCSINIPNLMNVMYKLNMLLT